MGIHETIMQDDEWLNEQAQFEDDNLLFESSIID